MNKLLLVTGLLSLTCKNLYGYVEIWNRTQGYGRPFEINLELTRNGRKSHETLQAGFSLIVPDDARRVEILSVQPS